MEKPEDCVLVIFGATGDLTKRKLMPALFALFEQNLLPEKFAVLGTSLTNFSDEEYRNTILENLRLYYTGGISDHRKLDCFAEKLFYHSTNAGRAEEFSKLKTRLLEIDKKLKTRGNFIYYLSTSPILFDSITDNLGKQALNNEGENNGWKRIVVEKPFGRDLESARALNYCIKKVFNEEQIYRIDHYLGKETVQNILAFRFSNGFVEPLWNRNYIDRVEITAAEYVGVEERAGYYDDYGALRDMVQNHLLQILGTIAIEPPSFFSADSVRNEMVKIFESLRPISIEEVQNNVVRGQYVGSIIGESKVSGYRDEKDIPPDSRTETFVALKLFIDNWRWGEVPFYLRTGKKLPTKVTEVVITFKKTPHHLFTQSKLCSVGCNRIIIRIQPDEGISLRFGMKKPGAGFMIEEVSMDFRYSDLSDVYMPSAYEHLILDCMLGDPTNFARNDAVEACWLFVDPILKAWKQRPEISIYGYPAGTWGPEESSKLFDDPSADWHYPCRNRATHGEFCEL